MQEHREILTRMRNAFAHDAHFDHVGLAKRGVSYEERLRLKEKADEAQAKLDAIDAALDAMTKVERCRKELTETSSFQLGTRLSAILGEA